MATVELVPDMLVRENGRERVEYHGEVSVRRGAKVGIAFEADIVDDRGRVVVAALAKNSGRGAAGAVLSSGGITAALPDGFYAVRFRAAVSPEGDVSDIIQDAQYVEVRNGRWHETTEIDWRDRSRATLAFHADVEGGL